MLTLITNLIIAARYFFQIKAVTAHYDLSLRIDKDIQEESEAIARLRDRGDQSAQLVADQLRARLIQRQGFAAACAAARPVPAASVAVAGGSADPVDGRDVHPASG